MEEEIFHKNRLLNNEAHSVNSIRDSAQIIIHKRGLEDDETKNRETKNGMSFRSNNKINV